MHALIRRSWLPALLVACAATPAQVVTGTATAAGGVQSTVASVVASTMSLRHYAHHPIDDAMSEAWFDAYLKDLDPERLTFLQSDIDEFAHWRDTLDDDIQSRLPTLEAGYAIRERWLARMVERVDMINALLDKGDFDFSDPKAVMHLKREGSPWPADRAAQDALWRERIAAQVLSIELGGDTRETAIKRIRGRYHRMLTELQDIDADDVLEPFLASLTTLYDPHSVWLKPISKANFDIEMADTLIGIGAVLQADEGYVTIKELVPGGPADASEQIHVGDKIVAVAQAGQEAVDVVDMRLDKVVLLIRGVEKTNVILTIWPADAKDPSQRNYVTITREKVKLEKSAAAGAVSTVDGLRIGVIHIPSFYEDDEGKQANLPDWGSTSRDTARILAQWEKEGSLDGLIIDLRDDGGGRLDQAIALTGLFIDHGPVVQIRDGEGNIEALSDNVNGVAYAGPLIVLTNEASASASEIFAGAIQDWGRGIVVGAETTHGKGSVQNLLPLNRMLPSRLFDGQDAGSLKFTTHMFFRVAGPSTQIEGVHSDIVLPSPYQGLKIKESDLDHPLPADRVPPAAYRPLPLNVDLAALREASAWRVKANVEFGFLAQELAERALHENDTTLSLFRDERLQILDRAKRVGEAREAARLALGRDPKKPDDAILDEAASVTRDYVRMLRGQTTLMSVAHVASPEKARASAADPTPVDD